MSMKILHLAETIRGGCGTYLNEIVPFQMQALGAPGVRCLVPAQHLDQLQGIPAGAVAVFDRPARRQGLARFAVAAWREIGRWRPDLIHAHSTFAGAIVRAMSRVRPMPPIVYCPHGWAFDAPRSALARAATRRAERLMAGWAARVIAISEAEARDGRRAGIDASRMVVVHNGIASAHTPERATWEDVRRKVLFVGRLDRQKGVDLLLSAVRGLEAAVSLRIVGNSVVSSELGGPSPNELPHVEFLGWGDREFVARQINACDIVVMPSRWEGFGLVAIEAMRAAKPVVATAVGGLVEIVVDGETGRLVPPQDVRALADALVGSDTAGWAAMGAAGRERFLRLFTSDRMNARLLALYAEVLEQPAPRADAPAASPEAEPLA